MSVLARERTISKLEFYMNARRLYKKLLFLMVRDFGVKPRAREPTFYTKGWSGEDKETFLTITRKYGITRIVDDYPLWIIEMLKNELSSNSSDVGDYKMVKIYEARIQGETDPYDANTLIAARKKIRDQINELQAELEKL